MLVWVVRSGDSADFSKKDRLDSLVLFEWDTVAIAIKILKAHKKKGKKYYLKATWSKIIIELE